MDLSIYGRTLTVALNVLKLVDGGHMLLTHGRIALHSIMGVLTQQYTDEV